jgi:hypothetical protein
LLLLVRLVAGLTDLAVEVEKRADAASERRTLLVEAERRP